jgi:predicted XRE-type DNA-binding protein
MKDPFQAAISKLTEVVHKAVRDVWPTLVASELMKLEKGGGTMDRKPSAIVTLAEIQKLKASGLSQADISRRLGISQPYVSRLLRGNSDLKMPPVAITMKGALKMYGTKVKAAKALGIPRQTFSDRLTKELAA